MKQKLKRIKELLCQIRDAAISDKSIKATMFEIGSLTSSVIQVVDEIESENIIKAEFSETESLKSDSVYQFSKLYTFFEDGRIRAKDLYDNYCDFCHLNSFEPLNSTAFGLSFKLIFNPKQVKITSGYTFYKLKKTTELKIDSNEHYNELLATCNNNPECTIKCSEGTYPKCKCMQVTDKVLSEQERADAVRNGSLSLEDYAMQKVDERVIAEESEDLSDEGIRRTTNQYIIDKYGELSINSFLDSFVEKSDEFETKSSDLYELYKLESQSPKPKHTTEFSQKLIDKGFEKKKIKGCMYWNLRIK